MKKLLTAGAVAGTLLASTAFATEAKAKTDDEALLGIGAAVLVGAAILASQDNDHHDRDRYRNHHDRRDYGRYGGSGHHYGKHRFNERKAARIAERRYHLDVQETKRRDGKIIVKGWDRGDHWTRIVFRARTGEVIKVKRTDRHRYDRRNRNRDYSYNERYDRWDRSDRWHRDNRYDRRGDYYNHRR